MISGPGWVQIQKEHHRTGPGCNKLAMLVVNISLKFQIFISTMPICFDEKSVRSLFIAEAEKELEILVLESFDKTCTRYKMEASAEKINLMIRNANDPRERSKYM